MEKMNIGGNGKHVRSIYTPYPLHLRMVKYCKETGMPVNSLINVAVREYLDARTPTTEKETAV